MKQCAKWKTYLRTLGICLLLGIGMFFMEGKQVSAAEVPVIKSCTAAGVSQLALEATLQKAGDGTCKIYRASKNLAKGGKFVLVDSFSGYGHTYEKHKEIPPMGISIAAEISQMQEFPLLHFVNQTTVPTRILSPIEIFLTPVVSVRENPAVQFFRRSEIFA